MEYFDIYNEIAKKQTMNYVFVLREIRYFTLLFLFFFTHKLFELHSYIEGENHSLVCKNKNLSTAVTYGLVMES